MPKKSRNNAMTFEDILADGENPGGMVNVGAYGCQKGTEPRDFLGRQDYSYNDRDGPNFGPLGPDFGLSDAEKKRMYGPFADVPAAPKRSRK